MRSARFVIVFALVALCASPAFAINSLSVNAGAALEGSFGLEVTIDGAANTDDTYVVTEHPTAETAYTFSFLIDPNDMSMDPTQYFLIGSIRKTNPPLRNFFLIYLRRSGSDQYWEIQSNVRDDSGSFQTWQTPVKICGDAGTVIPCTSVTPVEFRFEWVAADAGMTNGSMRVFKNGTVRKEFLNLDNDTTTIDEAWFGAIFMSNGTQNGASNANGSYYFDSFVSTR